MWVQGRSPQQGGLRAPSPTLGAPLEEEVEVRFGMPSDRSNVTVQLVTSPSRGATPPPHPGSAPGAGWAGQGPPGAPGFGRALAAAARFVMEKLAELRADVAKARLDLLKGDGSSLVAAHMSHIPSCLLYETATMNLRLYLKRQLSDALSELVSHALLHGDISLLLLIACSSALR